MSAGAATTVAGGAGQSSSQAWAKDAPLVTEL